MLIALHPFCRLRRRARCAMPVASSLALALLGIACDPEPYDPDSDGLVGLDDCAPYDAEYGEIQTWYKDVDGDGYGDDNKPVEGCRPTASQVADGTDCDDGDDRVSPGLEEIPGDGLNNDCDAQTLDDDFDGDGYPRGVDCEDEVAEINPGAEEIWYDGIDQDCDGNDDDQDGDAYTAHVDCDDTDPDIHPHADDECGDGVDTNCSGIDGERLYWYLDADGDGRGTTDDIVEACAQPDGYAHVGGDCDDADPTIHVGADEVWYDGVDQDCLGGDDYDGDGDGHASALYAEDGDDCDDSSSQIYPGADEICDGLDGDCDDAVDEESDDGTPPTGAGWWFADGDGDGYGDFDVAERACDAPAGYVSDRDDCDDGDAATNPGADEVWYDGVDQDCDGGDDYDADGDGDLARGYGGDDCDDDAADVYTGATEICDGADQDCDRAVDEDSAGASIWHADSDGDGYGDPATSRDACEAPSGYIADSSDCDDSDAGVHPSAAEDCGDGVDTDCDGELGVEWYADADGDGYGDPESIPVEACSQPSAAVLDASDCDDGAASVNPGADEICANGADDDCDGVASGCGPYGVLSSDDADVAYLGEAANDYAGYAVGGAGDVDGDGSPDLIVSAYQSDAGYTNGGAAWLILDPGEGEVALADSGVLLSAESGSDYAGSSVAGAGDVDGDGYDDVLVGAIYADAGGSSSGSVYLVQGAEGISGEIALADADARLVGEGSSDNAGRSVAGAGDVNDDGHDDLLVGAYGDDDGGSSAGAAYLILGPVSGDIDLSSADAKMVGEGAGDYAGVSVAGGFDGDGDGHGDLLIGAHRAAPAGPEVGAAYLVSGNVSGAMDLSMADARLIGESAWGYAGYAVAGAGDVDGDGYDDLLIGAYEAGATYLVLGPVSGDVPLSSADARLDGEAADDSGEAVASAGDVDADGRDDLLIGASESDGGGSGSGAAYLVLGPVSGVSSLSEAAGAIYGAGGGDALGYAVAGAGDVDGDGFDDLLLGAPEVTITSKTRAGAAYLLYGGAGF